MRPHFALFCFRLIEVCTLRLWEEIHGLRTVSEVHVGSDANDLVHARVLRWSRAEVPPNGVLPAKKLTRKRFVDDGHRARIGVVLVGDGASHHDAVPKSLEKCRRHAGPTG